MSEIYVKKINETELVVDGDRGALQEMSEYFSFFVESAKYSPQFRNHVWDGRIRLVNLRNNTTLIGLYAHIVKFCADRNYTFIDQTEEHLKPHIDDISQFEQWVQSLKLPFEPREYQLRAAKYAIQANRGLLLSPTGCHGKGTKVIMGSGLRKNVEDIVIGDYLMHPSFTEFRKVTKLYRGRSMMYRIAPSDGIDSFVVNDEHVLYLRKDNDNVQMYADQFFKLSSQEQNRYQLIRVNPFSHIDEYHHFNIVSIGVDDFYGFELDGDHLYMTDNYIINHNSGKSLIFYMLVRWMLKHDRKVCLVVPSTSLVEQMISDFKEYAANDDSFDVVEQVHGLHSKIKTTDPYNDRCVVSTWQSLIKYDKNLFETWDAVFVDEAHSCVAKSLNTVVGGAINARYKIGMTGSLSSCVCHEFQITGLLGSVYQVTTTKQLQEKGQLNQLEVYMVNMKYPAAESKQLWKETKELKKTYLDELDFINHHVKRQLFIRNLACSLKGTTLILFRLREHGEWLYKLIKEKVGDQRPVFHIDGKVDAKTREAIRTSINKGNENPILVFSVSTSATGLNLPKCENLILSPTKSKITTLQAVGRILRLAKDKGTSKVFDLVDDLRTGRRINHTYKHAQERLQIYSEQGFDIDFKEVQF